MVDFPMSYTTADVLDPNLVEFTTRVEGEDAQNVQANQKPVVVHRPAIGLALYDITYHMPGAFDHVSPSLPLWPEFVEPVESVKPTPQPVERPIAGTVRMEKRAKAVAFEPTETPGPVWFSWLNVQKPAITPAIDMEAIERAVSI